MTISNSIVLADNAYGTLASGLTVSDTSLSFTSGHGARFPTVASGQVLYCCLLNSNNVLEEIKVTAHTAGSDSATIVRAANSTTALAWNAGDRIEARISSEVLRHLQLESLFETTISTGDAGATYTGTTSPAWLGYVTGAIYSLKLSTTNSGTTPTIALNGLSAITVVLDGAVALVAGEMPLNGLYKYDGTNFVLLNPLGGNAATQTQMETATSLLTTVTPGKQQYHPGMAKAWVYFSPGASPTILASRNATSVAQNADGDYTITWSITMSSSAYLAIVSVVDQPAGDSAALTLACNVQTVGTSTTRVQSRRVSDGARTNPSAGYMVAIFGDI